MRFVFIFTAFFFLQNCSNFSECIDKKMFEKFGGTMFGSPNKITMKEIHLDNGTLLGQKVIVEGEIIMIGEHSTFMVATDESARMLVVLTNLTSAEVWLSQEKPLMVSILGVVERGKRGLPYIMAQSLSRKTVKQDQKT